MRKKKKMSAAQRAAAESVSVSQDQVDLMEAIFALSDAVARSNMSVADISHVAGLAIGGGHEAVILHLWMAMMGVGIADPKFNGDIVRKLFDEFIGGPRNFDNVRGAVSCLTKTKPLMSR